MIDFKAIAKTGLLPVVSGVLLSCLEPTTDPLPATPPPAPADVSITYDTVANTVRISWSPVKVSDLDGYLVFRNPAGSSDPQRLNPALVRDTFYVDSLNKPSDTADMSLEYRVKAQDKDAQVSPEYSKAVTVAMLAPLRTEVVFPAFMAFGQSIAVKGLLQSGLALDSVETTIWSGGTNVSIGKGFAISYNPLPAGRKKWNLESDAQLKIRALDSTAISGTYLLRVVTRAGKRVSVDSLPFELADLGINEKTLSAGAQANASLGSSIDLDLFRSHTIAVANSIAAEIDLIFGFSGSASIFSPDVAKNGSGPFVGFTFLSGLNPANRTDIRQTNGNYAAVQSRSQIDSLWIAATPVTNGILPVTQGTTFLAKSNKGLVVLLQAGNVVNASTGSATFSGKAKF